MNTQCGKERCACAIYPTFHDTPELAAFYPASELSYETRRDGLTAVGVTLPRRLNEYAFGSGDGSLPIYEPMSPGTFRVRERK